jgi:hypothetical protein
MHLRYAQPENRTVPTHHLTPDSLRWRSRPALAIDAGKGQKQTTCIDSPVQRRGGVECSENMVIEHGNKSTPFASYTENRTVPTHHRTADALRWRSCLKKRSP